MAQLKRKDGPTNDSFVRTKTTFDSDGRPQKRVRKSGEGLTEPTISKDAKPTSTIKSFQQPPKISKLKEEEPAFPRGGASVLTPLEHKQIQIDATRDVLFEQQNGPTTTTEVGSKKRKTKAKGKKNEEIAPKEETVKIEGLSYKRIVPGSLVLGQVSQINRHDIALALPNNLTGYVPITSISEKLTERIEKLVGLEDDDEEKSDDEEGSDEDILLDEMFTVGQYLRAYVTSTSDGSASNGPTKAKRRIELSLDPRQSNSGLSLKELVANAMVMASVVSVEDHGLIMSLGLDNNELKGFMSSKDIGHHVDTSKIKEGAVYMCAVTGLNPNGKIVKLCADTQKIANLKKGNYLAEAPTIDAFLPGTAVEVLVEDVTSKGITGKVMGMVDVTADLMHSGANSSNQSIEKKYKVGTKVKGRIICTFPNSEPKKLGISLQDHVLALGPQLSLQKDDKKHDPLQLLPLSTVVESVTVRKVQPGVGLFVDVGVKGVPGFVHISRVADKKIETLDETTGPYKVGSAHRGRIIGFNSLDGVFLVSLELSTIEQPYLRVEDLKIGEIVKGKVEKIVVNEEGVGGILVNLAEDITGLVPEMHMADIKLLHPERKFKEGMVVTARVLSTDLSRRRIRLTLKKTLVHSESPIFKSYEDIAPGMQSPGTLVNILPTGAVVQFFGTVRGFLPVGEMSEAYIQDPSQHFRIGQVVNVNVLSVDFTAGRLLVSCKDPSAFGLVQQTAMKNLKIGQLVSGSVTEKSSSDVSIDLEASGLRAVLPLHHLTDNSDQKNLSSLKHIRVGQRLVDLVVLEKMERSHSILVSNKPSLVNSAKEGTLITDFGDVKQNKIVQGFVSNITPTAVFVKFAGNVTGLLPKGELTADQVLLPDFGLKKFQPLTTRVLSVDFGQQRFLLTLNLDQNSQAKEQGRRTGPEDGATTINPVDPNIKSISDLSPGKLTKVRIASVKDTQINVQLADNIQGRIDISQVFDNWEDIKDRKHPLQKFAPKQVIDVKILGVHDARNHRFLPISHREGKNQVLELSAKPSDLESTDYQMLTLDQVKAGSSWIVYVNNIGDDCLWVNLSPNVRGRIRTLDLSEDVSLLKDLDANFPIGSALKVHVKNIDLRNNRLDLSARSAQSTKEITLQNLTEGMVLPGKVTRVNEKEVMVQLSDHVSGPVFLTDLADDFDDADTTKYSKNDIVRVCVTSIDLPNKKIRLSTRPSRVLNSSLPVKDPEITSIDQIKVNDIVRGFVKSVSDKGLFVFLGGNVVAYIRVSDLSDSFVKDWKSMFQADQLVKGKVIRCDPDINHVQLSLKASVLDKTYVPPITFDDLAVGQMVTGKVRKVENYGVFIVMDGSANVSGLCHRSEMADQKVDDVRQLYDEGDVVKAIVLKVDTVKKQVSFGLKASYFEENDGSDEEESDDEDGDGDEMEGVMLEGMSSDEDDDEDGGIELDVAGDISSDSDEFEDAMDERAEQSEPAVLDAGGFDWTAANLDEDVDQMDLDSEDDTTNEKPAKKKRRKPEIKVDRTGDLDANGPQSVGDYERLLLGQPDSAQLWIEYMAFQMQLSEISKARDIAERAIRTINIREESEKMDVWTALLNLEIAYGSEETVEETFKRACQYNDPQEMHERLISTYIQSGKHDKADALFQILLKKFFLSPSVWTNYAHFLMSTMSNPDAARALLPRAKQVLPTHHLLPLTLKFAALEFHSPSGSPERGRTIFEGLITTYPKRLDIWNQLLDLEIKQGEKDIVRGIFERGTKVKGLKPKGAKAWFKRWIEWEDKNGSGKEKEKATAKAQEWVRAFEERKKEKAQGGGDEDA